MTLITMNLGKAIWLRPEVLYTETIFFINGSIKIWQERIYMYDTSVYLKDNPFLSTVNKMILGKI